MRKRKFTKITAINMVIYAILIVTIFNIIGSTNHFSKVLNGTVEPGEIEMGSIDIPIMRPHEDTFFYINLDALQNDQQLEDRLLKNEKIHNYIYGLLLSGVFILLLLQLRKFIVSVTHRSFYSLSSIKNVKNIAYILFGGVIIDFLAYQSLQYVIPLSVTEERINYITMKENLLSNLTFSIDFTSLLLAFIFLAIAIVFKETISLKTQADLTI